MARGRQQKWICKDCKSEFSVQGESAEVLLRLRIREHRKGTEL